MRALEVHAEVLTESIRSEEKDTVYPFVVG